MSSVALPKVCGIETEYGIVVTGAPDANPIQSSSQLVNAYVSSLGRGPSNRVSWDFEDEMPGNDARGFSLGGSLPPEVETHLVNAVLTNGARFYVDHAHPEYSSPECINALQATLGASSGDQSASLSLAMASIMVGRGTSHVFLLHRVRDRFPLALAWFGAVAALLGPGCWDDRWAQAVRRISQTIRCEHGAIASREGGYDLVWPEYRWISQATKGPDAYRNLVRFYGRSLAIEVTPGAIAEYRLTGAEYAAPVSSSARERYLEDALESIATVIADVGVSTPTRGRSSKGKTERQRGRR